MTKVLIVDDDARIRKLMRVNLEKRGYEVTEAEDGASAIANMERDFPDLVILDLVMSGLSGIDVIRWVRERSDAPIILLSAHDDEQLKVEALDMGADDYVTKPFGYNEFLARVRAVMRRTGAAVDSSSEEVDKIAIGEFVIDLGARRAFLAGRDLELTRTEFTLLAELAKNADAIVSHDELLTRVWGPEYRGSSHYLHVYLGRVRKKMGRSYGELLENVPGVGYILFSKFPSS